MPAERLLWRLYPRILGLLVVSLAILGWLFRTLESTPAKLLLGGLAACGLALLPALLVVGALVLAFSLVAGVIGLILRIFGVLLLAVLALPLALGAFGLVLAIFVAMLHAMLPLIVIGVVVWLVVRHRRSAPASLPHAS